MDAMTFVLFGATGDLAKRKIFPALYRLYIDGKTPERFSIVGSGRREMNDAAFRQQVEQSLTAYSRRPADDRSKVDAFLELFRYCAADASVGTDYRKLLELVEKREGEQNIPQNRLFYLSVAPDFFDVIALHIAESGLGKGSGWKRLIIEKPFGHDLKSARRLNEKLSQAFEEDEVYRIDHYLGKPMVQNLEALEYANPVIQALWNNHYIANVQITASEIVGVEERAGYYDTSGAIRDMFQNHMLQLLMMIAMHLPHMTERDVRAGKRRIVESIRCVSPEEAGSSVVRGQYVAGEVQGKAVPGYTDEPGVAPSSQTDTFVAARLWLDDPFWEGVPFYIRTGKRLKEKSTRIVLEFKNPRGAMHLCGTEQCDPNLMIIEISPNVGVVLRLNSKNLLQEGKLEPIMVDFCANGKDIPEAYEILLSDALQGDATFFAHWNEVEQSWKWVQPVLEAFERNLVPLYSYPAGSNGPEAAGRLLEQDGFTWW
ncbi:glucose-6-phosphate dehydrogenase [Paenibacillus allorhizosphaerae]|uniref:Glucose-6-phosphate 1-dehydrogenase n=1 Tax=Paenibacillus allorhizosphaerae TaxID=2849866 RepID=A0ABM8VJP6_9BACL|nr:glucose-6-phosphate dehydrogenase [Paenibacillus allorhizosphaerae]CAG7645795.1 Glucose-6-phosphate 1-dehydrogenase [Paenibacillus allorhizosphaerae]